MKYPSLKEQTYQIQKSQRLRIEDEDHLSKIVPSWCGHHKQSCSEFPGAMWLMLGPITWEDQGLVG